MDDDIYQKLLGFALNYVSIRPRSEKEIREYLVKKIHRWGISETLLEDIINRLSELGYVDDLMFSQAFISSRNRFRPKGKRLITQELKRKGVAVEIVEKALNQLQKDEEGEESSQLNLARRAVQKRLQSFKRYDKQERRNKLYNFLLRRGFDHDTIRSLIDEILLKGLQ